MSALTLAPVSPQTAKLLHAIYADALAAAEASLQLPPPGAIVLPEPPTSGLCARYFERDGYRHLTLEKDFEYEISFHTPMLGDSKHSWRRPGLWIGSEERTDVHGRTWRSSIPGLFTIDDFGDLVEVPR